MTIAWATDIHLNFVEDEVASEFCARIAASACKALLIGGDIGEASDFSAWVAFIAERVPMPVYFVLGNHDYYGSDIGSVRATARSLCSPTKQWLPHAGVVALTDSIGLVGHGGWGDARLGDFLGAGVLLNDYVAIAELRPDGMQDTLACVSALEEDGPRRALQAKLHALGDEAAVALRPALTEALERFSQVYVLTHVPPFRGACWHAGRISNGAWLPGFTCKAIGDLLLEVAARFPQCRITVLCGHTHDAGEARPAANLEVLTGGARYGSPDFRVLDPTAS